MNKDLQVLFDQQKEDLKGFSGFAEEPPEVDLAILELVQRFPNINHTQVCILLQCFWPIYDISTKLESMIFDGRIREDHHRECLSLP